MEVSPFYKAPKQLFRSCGFVCKTTGQVIELSVSAKIVLMYMIDRSDFFITEKGKDHFETQSTIGAACGIDRRSAARALKLLVDTGVISAVKQRRLALSPHSQWYYRGVDLTVELVEKIGDDFVGMDTGLVIGRIEPPTVHPVAIDKKINNDYSDDFLNSVDYGD